ncbi:MAG: hypothetical protein KUA43_08815 [Hoeflea sp.]|uniref:DUF6074 family protein n=1 Tax=Hoeflea sp. TaxID=1940281 RepID=UPI001D4BE7D5|nr:DUF6074 family protein [Hoeflea sp.]MBU4529766.1 hypothetical protein [Alphaproteobacteria bacterium]MBU4543327.1 hypothetical protein [Alphaproteobacteria bacterium]MBU4552514.1 hypothetical protein [Alphaproteobacteria bacterium]MBV1723530.1 hypothetical protein [Hoeflea sp.]MBV1762979.1 hypothetical protein [Hoeflea sp.]
MTTDDLPLFGWTPPAPRRQVLLFPMINRVGKIRHVAKLLSTKNGDDADLYWRQIRSGLQKQLERVGATQHEIDTEIRAFFQAVQAELVRITYFDRNNGGAA